MATVVCQECSHEWQTRKPLDEIGDLRCSKCGSRNAQPLSKNSPGEYDGIRYGDLFEHFADGGSPAQAVQQGLGSPEDVKTALREYEELSEYKILKEERFRNLVETENFEGFSAGFRIGAGGSYSDEKIEEIYENWRGSIN